MTSSLPPALLQLFEPRPPLDYLPPLDRDPPLRRGPQISGVTEYLKFFVDPALEPPKPAPESLEERRKRKASGICGNTIHDVTCSYLFFGRP